MKTIEFDGSGASLADEVVRVLGDRETEAFVERLMKSREIAAAVTRVLIRPKLFSVVWTDNLNRSGESPGFDERLVITTDDRDMALRVCELLQRVCHVGGSDWFKVVSGDYKLSTFEP